MQVPFSPLRAIRDRRSVRGFSGEPVPAQLFSWLEGEASSTGAGPFGSRPIFVVVEPHGGKRTGGTPGGGSGAAGATRTRPLGTYGMIAGARGFIVCVADKASRMEDAGYLLEHLILRATANGLGTCWLAGTFDRRSFGGRIGLAEGEFIPAVSPFGFPAARRGIKERIIRAGARADTRRPWGALFFDAKPGVPLAEASAGPYVAALDAVRRGPSASNRQPWRVVRTDEGFRFFLARTRGYGAGLGFDVQRLDMGIAMCHFELAAREGGLAGRWDTEPNGGGKAELVPVATWVTG